MITYVKTRSFFNILQLYTQTVFKVKFKTFSRHCSHVYMTTLSKLTRVSQKGSGLEWTNID